MHHRVREAKFRVLDWKNELKNEKRRIAISLIFVAVAIIVCYASGIYAETRGTSVVSDILIDSIKPIDLSWIFVYGFSLICLLIFVYPLIFDVKDFFRTAYHFSLLTIMRSLFIIMTHLKTPADAISVSFPWPLSIIPLQNNMFFSGHTAIPLLGFFLFRDSKIKYLFLLSSIVMAVTVIVMHQHYTIDVASAFFIVYGTFHIGEWFLSFLENRKKPKEFRSERLY